MRSVHLCPSCQLSLSRDRLCNFDDVSLDTAVSRLAFLAQPCQTYEAIRFNGPSSESVAIRFFQCREIPTNNDIAATTNPPQRDAPSMSNSAAPLSPFARLNGRRLTKLNLIAKRFDYADLRHATLDRCTLRNCIARSTDCSSARILELMAHFTNFSKTRFSDAYMASSHFDSGVLQRVGLERAVIFDCRFTGANLRLANLTGATIERSDLSSAQFTFSAMPRTNLSHCSFNKCDLDDVDMQGAFAQFTQFNDAGLERSVMNRARFDSCSYARASLTGVQARHTVFTRCDFSFTDLSDSDLSSSVFTQCNFSNAMLERTVLDGASFQDVVLSNTSFRNATIGNTIFANVDLREAVALNELTHRTPSSIGVDTLYCSGGWAPNLFLSKTGIPDIFLVFLSELIMAKFSPLFLSCFISYSSKDRIFASRLDDELRKRGIYAYLDTREFIPGDFIREGIQTGVLQQDKVLLCASQNSLQGSFWVDEEVTTTLQKEERVRRETGNKVSLLIPIDLDGFLFSDECKTAVKAQLISRIVADFRGWQEDPKLIEKRLVPVLAALKAKRYEPSRGIREDDVATQGPSL